MKLNKIIATTLLCFTMTFAISEVTDMGVASAKTNCCLSIFKKKSKQKSLTAAKDAKKESAYAKLFKDKSFKTEKGFMTLHKIEDKIYVELPLSLMGRNLVLNSGIERVSDMDLAYIGQKASKTSNIVFTKTDSMVMIKLADFSTIVDPDDKGIRKALERSNIGPVITSASIITYSPDSTSVVFDATPFFLGGSDFIVNVNRAGFVSYEGRFVKENSSLNDVVAFKDNVSVVSDMSFGMTSNVMGFSGTEVPFTATIRTTIGLLPDSTMTMRLADTRLGTAVTGKTRYSSKEQGLKDEYLANRWRLEPSDKEAYSLGKLVNPVKPIVFYIDTLFPPKWSDAIKAGVEKWNTSFEKIGFKNVITAVPYPRNDSSFSANNAKISCIKYSQTQSRAVGKSILTDPRTGEILSASMYFSREMPVVLQRDRLIQTAATDKTVRDNKLTDEAMCETITALMMRETGYCLGLAYNMAGSASYPVDSLRSPAYTSKNGLSASVMDHVLFNYVAQPGDMERGVQMIIANPGVYDDFAIRWLYTPIASAATPEQEKATLDQWIMEKAKDPRYRYGERQQLFSLTFDPRSIPNDLGDDILKSTRYALKNLKYVVDNAYEWVYKDNTDEAYKELFVDFIFLRLYENVTQLCYSLGGVYFDENFAKNNAPKNIPLPRARQREILMYILELCNDMTWTNNEKLLRMGGPNGNMSDFCESNCFKLLFSRFTALSVSSTNATNPYKVKDMTDDICGFVLKKVKTGEEITKGNKLMLDYLVAYLMHYTNLKGSSNGANGSGDAFSEHGASVTAPLGTDNGLHRILQKCFPNGELPENMQVYNVPGFGGESFDPIGGFTPLTGIKYMMSPDTEVTFFMALKDIKQALDKGASLTRDNSLKNHYQYTSMVIAKALNGK